MGDRALRRPDYSGSRVGHHITKDTEGSRYPIYLVIVLGRASHPPRLWWNLGHLIILVSEERRVYNNPGNNGP